MKTLSLICTISLVASCPSWAGDKDGRFLEFQLENGTQTYDLSTAQMIQPSRFTIVSTTIDNPDVMRFELGALDTLRNYCARVDGKYPVPANVFTLGPPDMPVQNIDVASNPTNSDKRILWSYPYKRLTVHDLGQTITVLSCNLASKKEDLSYFWKAKAMITDGTRQKSLFDCKRGLMGFYLYDKEDALTDFVLKGTQAFEEYRSVCRAVTHEAPYLPE
jgi:hypothetical protein